MKYAIIKNGICINIIMANTEYAKKLNAVELPDGFGIGDLYVNGEWSHPEVSELESEPTASGDLEQIAIDHEYRLTLLELGL